MTNIRNSIKNNSLFQTQERALQVQQMAEPFLCQGLWQIRDLKLSAGLRNVSEFLRRNAAKKFRKFLDMVMKGCNKQRTVLFRLTVLLGGCQRSGSTSG